MRFSRELDHLTSKSEFALQLGLVALELLELPIALIAHRLAARLLGVVLILRVIRPLLYDQASRQERARRSNR
ncbi:MAG: hypothetical protein JWN04_5683 [Myxococcaceae bacterium]|nr:hypothetical protein [Myxococcaceae bacterium]